MHLGKIDVRYRKDRSHEKRADHRTQYGPCTPDDAHEDGVEGPIELQHRVGVDMKEIGPVEAPADAAQKRRLPTRARILYFRTLHPMGGGRGLVFPYRPESQSDPRLYHEVEHPRRDDGEEEARPIVGLHGGIDRRGEMKAVGCARQLASLDEDCLDDLAYAEGPEGEVITPQPEKGAECR